MSRLVHWCGVLLSQCRRVLLGALFGTALISVCQVSVYAAFRKEASVTFGAEYDSNVNFSAEERDNTGYLIGGQVGLSQSSARFDSQLRLNLERYWNSDTSDETRPSGFLSSRMTLVRSRLFWTLNDTFSQVRVNPLGAFVLDNTSNTNTLSTGPDWIIPFSSTTQLRLSARHERVDYDEVSRADRERDNFSAVLTHAFSPRWSINFSHNRLWETFDIVDREISTNKVGLNQNGKRVSWSVATGRSSVAGGLLSTDERDASLRVRITENTSFFATYGLSLNSDIGGALAFTGERLDNIRFLAGECARGLGGVRGQCDQLPGVSALPVSDQFWVYRRDSLPGYLSEQRLIDSYLNDFSFDSALFESEAYTAGIQFSLKRLQVLLSFREDEQRQSFEAATGTLFSQPDIINTQTTELAFSAPITGRLSSRLSLVHRLPKLEELLRSSESEEHQASITFTWTVEPRLFVSLSASHSEYESDVSGALQTSDNQSYALNIRYRLQ